MTVTVQFVVCDAETGEIKRSGVCSQTLAGSQAADDSEVSYEVPSGVVSFQALDLAPLKSELSKKVNDEAEAIRLQYITPGDGQMMTYQYKAAEARAYLAASSPVDTDYPFLYREAIETGVTVGDLAASVVSAVESQWVSVGSVIEGLRRGACVRIEAATTIPAVFSASSFNWAEEIASRLAE